MQTARIVQAVVLMLIVALAASCAASKEYSSKIFAPRTGQEKDSTGTAIKFLEMDSAQRNEDGWVSTDIIMGRDTTTGTTALDNLAVVFPAKTNVATFPNTIIKTDSAVIAVPTVIKPSAPAETTVAKTSGAATGTRTKRSRSEKP